MGPTDVHGTAFAPEAERTATWCMTLEPDLTRSEQGRELVDEVADLADMDVRARFQLKVAVHEALMNAIEHGAAFRAPVQLGARLEGGHVTFVVADPGPTFRIARPVGPDLRDRGRGLMLILRCVDELSLHPLPVGKELRLKKRLADAGHVDA